MNPSALNTIICSISGLSPRRGACGRPVRGCTCHNRVLACNSSSSKNLWGTAFHAYDTEVNPDGYRRDGSPMCGRNLLFRSRAIDHSTPGARATSSPFARRCSRFGAENHRAPTAYPGLQTWPISARDCPRRVARRTHHAVGRGTNWMSSWRTNHPQAPYA